MKQPFVRAVKTACALIALGMVGLPVQAQSPAPGQVIVIVREAGNGKPIDSAEVFLLGGDSPQSSLTNAQGLLLFPDTPPGLYRVAVEHAGFQRTELTTFEVREGKTVRLDVLLVRDLKIIGDVVAHSAIIINGDTIDENGAQRKISQSLSDALGKLAGVNVYDQDYGANSAFNISINGHDPSQTGYSLNGIRVGGGGAASLLGAGQDLFSGASVNFNTGREGFGGGINFTGLRPTKAWTYQSVFTAGNYGSSAYSFSATGTAGKVGLALQHTMSGRDSFLSGLFYPDQSGQSYEHIGGSRRDANLISIGLALSRASSLRLNAVFNSSVSNDLCTQFTAALPCGNGPGYVQRSGGGFDSAIFESLAGHVSYQLFVAGNDFITTSSQPQRSVNGVVSPFSSRFTYPYLRFGGSASVTKTRHTFTFGADSGQGGGTSTATYNGIPRSVNAPVQRTSDVYVSDRVKANDKLALAHAFDVTQASGSGTSGIFSENLTWQPKKDDVFQGSVSVGSSGFFFGGKSPIGDPLSAQYDCYNRSVFVSGPGDDPTRQTDVSYSASWRHTFRGGFVSLNLYRDRQFGQSFYGAVPIGGEPASIFPNGSAADYLAQLQQTWSQPTICGATAFDPQRVYVNQNLSGLAQANQGVNVSARIPLGRNLIALPTYAVTSTYLSTLDPRLNAPGSFYSAGLQLPHRPLRTAGLTLDGILPHAKLEWLANAQYTDANNPQNLPAFTTVSAGLVFHPQVGTITVLESNLFGSHTGLFTTYQGINPIGVQGGGTFAYATTPLPPRQWSVTFRIPWTQHIAQATPVPSPTPAKTR